MSETERTGVQRRQVLKGAAWATPVIAASATVPFASAASPEPEPECPGCLKPGVGVFELAGVAASSRATLAMAAPVILDATDCGSLVGNFLDFKPAFTFVVTKATLTMSNGDTYDSRAGLAPGAGSLGTIGGLAGVFVFSDVRVDENNNRIGLPRLRPESLTVTINTTYKWGLGAELLCPNTLVYDLSSAVNISLLALGAGPLTYTGVTSALD